MSADGPENLAEGSLISHLVELRDRLLRAVICIGVVFLPCAIYSNQLFTLVATPLIEKMPAGTSMIATSLVSPFLAQDGLDCPAGMGRMPFAFGDDHSVRSQSRTLPYPCIRR